ncbi:MAG: hypothetical protein ABIC36_01400 [bacterium]
MKKENKPIFVFPYHDPKGEYNKIFKKNLGLLKDIFSGVCVSATLATVNNNADFLSFLRDEGCVVHKNNNGSMIGDHFRNALNVGLKKYNIQPAYFYFGFIDRVLFDLETKFKDKFIEDIKTEYKEDFIIFSRSKEAWQTHPKDYCDLEKIIADAGRIFTDKILDWIWCGALIKKDLAELIVKDSKLNDFAVLAEFIMIARKNDKTIESKDADWLAWEEPFWAKQNNQSSPSNTLNEKEKAFRLSYCLKAMELFLK